MKKLRFLVLIAVMTLEVGCGLPDSYFLQPPAVLSIASITSSYFTFTNPVHDHNHDINVTYSGDELFYKFYADSSEVEVSAYDQSSSTDPSTQLIAKGFWPICLSTDPAGSRTEPPIPENGTASTGSTVTVTISSTGESSYVMDTNAPVNIRRDVANSSLPTQYKTFQSNTNGGGLASGSGFLSADLDFATVASDSMFNGSTFYVAWYAISYGLTNTSTPSRSAAVYMGYMVIPYT